ncbi:hypothetical protein CRG98_034685 [Punica granatum]|uniref:Uncharacterized protein n=1 Tax=Punica granatum TaxID=22663 RepID=A0A2I0IMI2_PUNGR|nr:hypothetical protein CRG98_034685 [Punica granatum]
MTINFISFSFLLALSFSAAITTTINNSLLTRQLSYLNPFTPPSHLLHFRFLTLHSGPPAPTKSTNSDLGRNSTSRIEEGSIEARVTIHTRVSEGKSTFRGHGLQKRSRGHQKVTTRNWRSRAVSRHRGDKSRHCDTIHRWIAGVSEGTRYRVLKIPHGTKTTNVTSARISEFICLSRATPEHSQMALQIGFPRLSLHK